MNDYRLLVVELASMPEAERWRAVDALSPALRHALLLDWRGWAHAGQLAPPGDWRVWLIRAGRGFGKTRAGAEWVTEIARTVPNAQIALVAATLEEGRRVMIEGDSGVLAIARREAEPEWVATKGEITFASGAKAFLYSAERPDALRGPQHHAAWCDELAKWRYGDAAWDNLMLGLRLGDRPRVVVTTTPQPVALMRRVMALPGTVETRGRTADNVHLAPSFHADMQAIYGGSRLGRQELEGELIDDIEGALWTRATIDACQVAVAPALRRVVVAVDPPASAEGDACGIVAVGLGEDERAYVLEDASVAGETPAGWAAAVAACAARHGADRVVAEKNQGGDMVRAVLEGADRAMPIRLVHASRGKLARAEPVAAHYEAGRVRHVGAWPALEDELCGLVVGGAYRGPGRSPDRADALVWAVTTLLRPAHQAGVRQL